VIEKFLASRCERPQRTSAWLLRSCKEVGGRDLPRERFGFDCGTLALSRESPSP
jgi:hypothetical protein